jgi:hypothetical protein
LSILESSRHELRIAHGLTLMTPSLRGWEAFPTPGALTHTRITWASSPPAPQVPGVTPGSPLCPWCFGHPFWRGARVRQYSMEIGHTFLLFLADSRIFLVYFIIFQDFSKFSLINFLFLLPLRSPNLCSTLTAHIVVSSVATLASFFPLSSIAFEL